MAAPPGGLAILVDEKRVNELLQQKSGLKALLRSTFNTVLFVLFLLLFTSLALSEPLYKMRAFEGYLRKRFDSSAAIPLKDVYSVESFWRYHNESFMPAIYGQDTAKYSYPGAVVATWLQVDGPNYLYGMGRVRALNVKPNADCRVAQQFQSYFPTCYGPFSLHALDRERYGPGNDEGVPSWSFGGDPEGESYTGILATYPPGGYIETFTPDYLTTNANFYTMRTDGFLSEKTRVVFLEFTIYNFNLGLYGVCRIVFEIAAAGDWTQTFEIDVLMQRNLQPLGSGSTEDWLFLILEAALLLFVIRYVLEEAAEFVGFESKNGKMRLTIKWDYFLDAWNILDWFNLIMMIITVCYKIDTWAKAGALYVISPADWNAVTRDMYSNFHGVSSNIRQVHSLVAFNTILTWFKAVKYINIIPYVTTFMQTVSISQVNLGSWIVVFCCTLTGFVLAFSTAFGADVSALRTPFQAFVFIMLTILGNSDVSVIYEVAPFLGSLLIIIYVVGIFFVIMNLFYAIIVSTLSDAKMEEDAKQKKKWAVMGDRINDTWKALNRGGKLEKQFRSCFPGLYSRLMRRQKRIELKEKARDDMVLAKEMKLRREDMSLALGPGSSAWGRRPKRQLATVAMEDKESDSDASEPDLGPCPLRSSDQLREKEDNLFAPVMDDEPTEQDLTDEGIDLVIDATRHVAFGVVERTKGARGVLFGEMSESMDVLNNVATVLEVLGKRTRDLEAQQRQILRRRPTELFIVLDCSRNCDSCGVWQVWGLEEIHRWQPPEATAVLKRLARQSRWDLALEVLQLMMPSCTGN
ncbi:unnamed protein product [Durusdinium trenchii]|uniref:Uncharacterized protein n=1 Tax=Durusdinium trenchii TaxID=1381693 RepID=A0ABP0Q1P3_9DINO